MEQEIKFRGKSIRTGEWVYGTYAFGCFYPDSHKTHRIFPLGEEIDEKTLGQYSVLSDISGKEIYKGDLLDISPYEGENYTVEVKTIEGSPFCIETPWNSEYDYFALASYIQHFGNVEIVNNIHERSEDNA